MGCDLRDLGSPSLRRNMQKRLQRVLLPFDMFALVPQLCGILHSSWIFPRDNEWIFTHYRALMDLGSNSGPCLRA